MKQQLQTNPNPQQQQYQTKYITQQKSFLQWKHIQQLLKDQKYKYVSDSIIFLQKYTSQDMMKKLYISFNGGKDATIVLFLFKMALQKKSREISGFKGHLQKLQCLYFREPKPLMKLDSFRNHIMQKNNLIIHQLPTKKYSQQLKSFARDHSLQYVIMGSRRNDPYCQNLGLQALSDTHKGYPYFIRVNPIIQWSYDQVWTFIKTFQIPYCSLYEQGYTYLGNSTNTIKNQNLYNEKRNQYKHAHEACDQVQKQSRKSTH